MVAMLETGRVKDQLEALKVTGCRCSLGGFVRVGGGGSSPGRKVLGSSSGLLRVCMFLSVWVSSHSPKTCV